MQPQLPREFKAELYKEFDFTNEFTDEKALLHTWGEGRILISPLPPFRAGSIELYVNKALKSKAEVVVLVLPCDTSTDWFHKILEAKDLRKEGYTETRFIKGRLRYEGTQGESRFKNRVPAVTVVIRNPYIP